ncbi:HEAT repeat domain-containing protein, partial [Rhodococcus opacus]
KTLVNLRHLGKRLPEEVADTLVDPLRRLMLNGAKNHYFFGIQDIRGEAAGALASIRPSAVSDAELRDMMTAEDSDQRQAAVRLIASRGIGKGIDTLWAMSRDSDAWVQSVIANHVAIAASQDEEECYMPLLSRLLSSEGTLIARLVADALKDLPESVSADKLADLLRDHISGEVRRSVAAYEERTQAT